MFFETEKKTMIRQISLKNTVLNSENAKAEIEEMHTKTGNISFRAKFKN